MVQHTSRVQPELPGSDRIECDCKDGEAHNNHVCMRKSIRSTYACKLRPLSTQFFGARMHGKLCHHSHGVQAGHSQRCTVGFLTISFLRRSFALSDTFSHSAWLKSNWALRARALI
jgi:hypothetical protein